MARATTRNVEGLDDLVKTLKDMEGAARADVLSEAVMEGMEPIRSRAAEKAPKRTGKLRSEIAKEIVGARTGVVAGHVGPTDKAFYGRFLEFGWRPTGRSTAAGKSMGTTKRGKKLGGEWQAASKVPPKPFLRPAVNEQKEAAFQHFRLSLMRWFDRIR